MERLDQVAEDVSMGRCTMPVESERLTTQEICLVSDGEGRIWWETELVREVCRAQEFSKMRDIFPTCRYFVEEDGDLLGQTDLLDDPETMPIWKLKYRK